MLPARHTNLFTKAISTTLSLVIFLTQSVLGHSAETNLWKERRDAAKNQVQQLAMNLPAPAPSFRRKPESSFFLEKSYDLAPGFRRGDDLGLNIPLQYGSIRKVLKPKDQRTKSKTIIHIQDIHMNREAQKNIGRTISALVASGKVGVIALEGAARPIDLTPFHQFPQQEAVWKVADYLLAENKISGPIHALLVAPAKAGAQVSNVPLKKGQELDPGFRRGDDLPPVIGIDDARHYALNVQAYHQSAPLQKKLKAQLETAQHDLNEKKLSTFNPQLALFDAKVEGYRTGKVMMGEYVKLLSPTSTKGTQVRLFLEALQLEQTLDFNRVESERARLVQKLLTKLDKSQTYELLQVTAGYRSGGASHTEFYDYLTSLCRRSGVELSQYPAMDAYIRYVLLSESIDGDKLFEETKQLEENAYAALAKTAAEKELVNQARQIYLTQKLVDYSLTKEEWYEFKNTVHGPWSIDYGPKLSQFESFYRQAELRDDAMAQNLLAQISSKNIAVLVTGGFHSAGIDQRLTAAGCTVVSFTPKITKVDTDGGSAYLSVFTQEKTPLARLFEGQKLFLSFHPFDPLVQNEAAAQTAAAATTPPADLDPSVKSWLVKFWGWTDARLQHASGGVSTLRATIRHKAVQIKLQLTDPNKAPIIIAAGLGLSVILPQLLSLLTGDTRFLFLIPIAPVIALVLFIYRNRHRIEMVSIPLSSISPRYGLIDGDMGGLQIRFPWIPSLLAMSGPIPDDASNLPRLMAEIFDLQADASQVLEAQKKIDQITAAYQRLISDGGEIPAALAPDLIIRLTRQAFLLNRPSVKDFPPLLANLKTIQDIFNSPGVSKHPKVQDHAKNVISAYATTADMLFKAGDYDSGKILVEASYAVLANEDIEWEMVPPAALTDALYKTVFGLTEWAALAIEAGKLGDAGNAIGKFLKIFHHPRFKNHVVVLAQTQFLIGIHLKYAEKLKVHQRFTEARGKFQIAEDLYDNPTYQDQEGVLELKPALERTRKSIFGTNGSRPQPGASALWTLFGIRNLYNIGNYEGWMIQSSSIVALVWMIANHTPQGPPLLMLAAVVNFAFIIWAIINVIIFAIHYFFGVITSDNNVIRPTFEQAIQATITANWSFVPVIGPHLHGLANLGLVNFGSPWRPALIDGNGLLAMSDTNPAGSGGSSQERDFTNLTWVRKMVASLESNSARATESDYQKFLGLVTEFQNRLQNAWPAPRPQEVDGILKQLTQLADKVKGRFESKPTDKEIDEMTFLPFENGPLALQAMEGHFNELILFPRATAIDLKRNLTELQRLLLRVYERSAQRTEASYQDVVSRMNDIGDRKEITYQELLELREAIGRYIEAIQILTRNTAVDRNKDSLRLPKVAGTLANFYDEVLVNLAPDVWYLSLPTTKLSQRVVIGLLDEQNRLYTTTREVGVFRDSQNPDNLLRFATSRALFTDLPRTWRILVLPMGQHLQNSSVNEVQVFRRSRVKYAGSSIMAKNPLTGELTPKFMRGSPEYNAELERMRSNEFKNSFPNATKLALESARSTVESLGLYDTPGQRWLFVEPNSAGLAYSAALHQQDVVVISSHRDIQDSFQRPDLKGWIETEGGRIQLLTGNSEKIELSGLVGKDVKFDRIVIYAKDVDQLKRFVFEAQPWKSAATGGWYVGVVGGQTAAEIETTRTELQKVFDATGQKVELTQAIAPGASFSDRFGFIITEPKTTTPGASSLWTLFGIRDLYNIGNYEGWMIQSSSIVALAWMIANHTPQGPPLLMLAAVVNFAILIWAILNVIIFAIHYFFGVITSDNEVVRPTFEQAVQATVTANWSFVPVIGPHLHGLANLGLIKFSSPWQPAIADGDTAPGRISQLQRIFQGSNEAKPASNTTEPTDKLDGFLNTLEGFLQKESAPDLAPLFEQIEQALTPASRKLLAEARQVFPNSVVASSEIPSNIEMMDVLLALGFYLGDILGNGISTTQEARLDKFLRNWGLRAKDLTTDSALHNKWNSLYGYLTGPFLINLAYSEVFTQKNSTYNRFAENYPDNAISSFRDRHEKISLLAFAYHLHGEDRPQSDEVADIRYALASYEYALKRLAALKNDNSKQGRKNRREFQLCIGAFLAGMTDPYDKFEPLDPPVKQYLWKGTGIPRKIQPKWRKYRNQFKQLNETYGEQIRESLATFKTSRYAGPSFDKTLVISFVGSTLVQLAPWDGTQTMEEMMMARPRFSDMGYRMEFLEEWFKAPTPATSRPQETVQHLSPSDRYQAMQSHQEDEIAVWESRLGTEDPIRETTWLIVEDDLNYRGELVQELRQAGVTRKNITMTSTSEEALELLKNNPGKFQIVVLDNFLAGKKTGVQALYDIYHRGLNHGRILVGNSSGYNFKSHRNHAPNHSVQLVQPAGGKYSGQKLVSEIRPLMGRILPPLSVRFDGYLNELETLMKGTGEENLQPVLDRWKAELPAGVQAMLDRSMRTLRYHQNEDPLPPPAMIDLLMAMALHASIDAYGGPSRQQARRWDRLIRNYAKKLQKTGSKRITETTWIKHYGYLTGPALVSLAYASRFHDKAESAYNDMSIMIPDAKPSWFQDRCAKFTLTVLGVHLSPNIFEHEKTDIMSALTTLEYALIQIRRLQAKGPSTDLTEWQLAVGGFLTDLAPDSEGKNFEEDLKPFFWGTHEIEGIAPGWLGRRNRFKKLLLEYGTEMQAALQKSADDMNGHEHLSFRNQDWLQFNEFVLTLPDWDGKTTLEDKMIGEQNYATDPFLRSLVREPIKGPSMDEDDQTEIIVWRKTTPGIERQKWKFAHDRIAAVMAEKAEGTNQPAGLSLLSPFGRWYSDARVREKNKTPAPHWTRKWIRPWTWKSENVMRAGSYYEELVMRPWKTFQWPAAVALLTGAALLLFNSGLSNPMIWDFSVRMGLIAGITVYVFSTIQYNTYFATAMHRGLFINGNVYAAEFPYFQKENGREKLHPLRQPLYDLAIEIGIINFLMVGCVLLFSVVFPEIVSNSYFWPVVGITWFIGGFISGHKHSSYNVKARKENQALAMANGPGRGRRAQKPDSQVELDQTKMQALAILFQENSFHPYILSLRNATDLGQVTSLAANMAQQWGTIRMVAELISELNGAGPGQSLQDKIRASQLSQSVKDRLIHQVRTWQTETQAADIHLQQLLSKTIQARRTQPVNFTHVGVLYGLSVTAFPSTEAAVPTAVTKLALSDTLSRREVGQIYTDIRRGAASTGLRQGEMMSLTAIRAPLLQSNEDATTTSRTQSNGGPQGWIIPRLLDYTAHDKDNLNRAATVLRDRRKVAAVLEQAYAAVETLREKGTVTATEEEMERLLALLTKPNLKHGERRSIQRLMAFLLEHMPGYSLGEAASPGTEDEQATESVSPKSTGKLADPKKIRFEEAQRLEREMEKVFFSLSPSLRENFRRIQRETDITFFILTFQVLGLHVPSTQHFVSRVQFYLVNNFKKHYPKFLGFMLKEVQKNRPFMRSLRDSTKYDKQLAMIHRIYEHDNINWIYQTLHSSQEFRYLAFQATYVSLDNNSELIEARISQMERIGSPFAAEFRAHAILHNKIPDPQGLAKGNYQISEHPVISGGDQITVRRYEVDPKLPTVISPESIDREVIEELMAARRVNIEIPDIFTDSPTHRLSQSQLLDIGRQRKAQGMSYQYLLGFVNYQYNGKDFYDAFPDLEAINLFSTGTNNVSPAEVKTREKPIQLTNAPGPLTQAMAELNMGMLLEAFYDLQETVRIDTAAKAGDVPLGELGLDDEALASVLWGQLFRTSLRLDEMYKFGKDGRFIGCGVHPDHTVMHSQLGSTASIDYTPFIGLVGMGAVQKHFARYAKSLHEDGVARTKYWAEDGQWLSAEEEQELGLIRAQSHAELNETCQFTLNPESLKNYFYAKPSDREKLNRTLHNETLHVMGLGAIGGRTAHMVHAMGGRIAGLVQNPDKYDHLKKLGWKIYGKEQKADFLRDANMLLIIPKVTKDNAPELTNWLDKDAMDLLADNAIIINTARGLLVNEAVLAEEATRRNFYVRTDVLVVEAKDTLNNPLVKSPYVKVSGHTGSAVPEVRQAMQRTALFKNLIPLLDGQKPAGALGIFIGRAWYERSLRLAKTGDNSDNLLTPWNWGPTRVAATIGFIEDSMLRPFFLNVASIIAVGTLGIIHHPVVTNPYILIPMFVLFKLGFSLDYQRIFIKKFHKYVFTGTRDKRTPFSSLAKEQRAPLEKMVKGIFWLNLGPNLLPLLLVIDPKNPIIYGVLALTAVLFGIWSGIRHAKHNVLARQNNWALGVLNSEGGGRSLSLPKNVGWIEQEGDPESAMARVAQLIKQHKELKQLLLLGAGPRTRAYIRVADAEFEAQNWNPSLERKYPALTNPKFMISLSEGALLNQDDEPLLLELRKAAAYVGAVGQNRYSPDVMRELLGRKLRVEEKLFFDSIVSALCQLALVITAHQADAPETAAALVRDQLSQPAETYPTRALAAFAYAREFLRGPYAYGATRSALPDELAAEFDTKFPGLEDEEDDQRSLTEKKGDLDDVARHEILAILDVHFGRLLGVHHESQSPIWQNRKELHLAMIKLLEELNRAFTPRKKRSQVDTRLVENNDTNDPMGMILTRSMRTPDGIYDPTLVTEIVPRQETKDWAIRYVISVIFFTYFSPAIGVIFNWDAFLIYLCFTPLLSVWLMALMITLQHRDAGWVVFKAADGTYRERRWRDEDFDFIFGKVLLVMLPAILLPVGGYWLMLHLHRRWNSRLKGDDPAGLLIARPDKDFGEPEVRFIWTGAMELLPGRQKRVLDIANSSRELIDLFAGGDVEGRHVLQARSDVNTTIGVSVQKNGPHAFILNNEAFSSDEKLTDHLTYLAARWALITSKRHNDYFIRDLNEAQERMEITEGHFLTELRTVINFHTLQLCLERDYITAAQRIARFQSSDLRVEITPENAAYLYALQYVAVIQPFVARGNPAPEDPVMALRTTYAPYIHHMQMADVERLAVNRLSRMLETPLYWKDGPEKFIKTFQDLEDTLDPAAVKAPIADNVYWASEAERLGVPASMISTALSHPEIKTLLAVASDDDHRVYVTISNQGPLVMKWNPGLARQYPNAKHAAYLLRIREADLDPDHPDELIKSLQRAATIAAADATNKLPLDIFQSIRLDKKPLPTAYYWTLPLLQESLELHMLIDTALGADATQTAELLLTTDMALPVQLDSKFQVTSQSAMMYALRLIKGLALERQGKLTVGTWNLINDPFREALTEVEREKVHSIVSAHAELLFAANQSGRPFWHDNFTLNTVFENFVRDMRHQFNNGAGHRTPFRTDPLSRINPQYRHESELALRVYTFAEYPLKATLKPVKGPYVNRMADDLLTASGYLSLYFNSRGGNGYLKGRFQNGRTVKIMVSQDTLNGELASYLGNDVMRIHPKFFDLPAWLQALILNHELCSWEFPAGMEDLAFFKWMTGYIGKTGEQLIAELKTTHPELAKSEHLKFLNDFYQQPETIQQGAVAFSILHQFGRDMLERDPSSFGLIGVGERMVLAASCIAWLLPEGFPYRAELIANLRAPLGQASRDWPYMLPEITLELVSELNPLVDEIKNKLNRLSSIDEDGSGHPSPVRVSRPANAREQLEQQLKRNARLHYSLYRLLFEDLAGKVFYLTVDDFNAKVDEAMKRYDQNTDVEVIRDEYQRLIYTMVAETHKIKRADAVVRMQDLKKHIVSLRPNGHGVGLSPQSIMDAMDSRSDLALLEFIGRLRPRGFHSSTLLLESPRHSRLQPKDRHWVGAWVDEFSSAHLALLPGLLEQELRLSTQRSRNFVGEQIRRSHELRETLQLWFTTRVFNGYGSRKQIMEILLAYATARLENLAREEADEAMLALRRKAQANKQFNLKAHVLRNNIINLQNVDEFPAEAAYWPVESLLVNRLGNFEHLSEGEERKLAEETLLRMKSERRDRVTFEQARHAALRANGNRTVPVESMLWEQDILLDLRLRNSKDVPEAVRLIQALVQQVPGNSTIYIPIRSGLKPLVEKDLSLYIRQRIVFKESSQGFHDGGVFQLDDAVQAIGIKHCAGIRVALQGEYAVTQNTLDQINPVLVAIHFVAGRIVGVVMTNFVLQKINSLARTLTAA